jgi:tetratricopeptide (TPR) repeat protein
LQEADCDVSEYLAIFSRNAHQLLDSHTGSSDAHNRVSGTWTLSNELLTDNAKHLFNLCAFFSPEPISARLFLQDVTGIDDPPGLTGLLSSPQNFRAAANQLHRLSLVKVDAARDLIQMHRVVQAVTQGRLREDQRNQFEAYRSAVDALLAGSNPGNPDHVDSDAAYDLSLQHLESDHRFLVSPNQALRDLIIDQVRRLHLRGAHVEAMQFGQEALKIWRERHGHDDLRLLSLEVEVAVAMYRGGLVADAHSLILRIQPLLANYSDGAGFRVFLLCENIHGAILRARSQFREALDRDIALLSKSETLFGETHTRTLNVRNNIAFDYRQLGRFDKALEFDQRTYADREQILGPRDPETLLSRNAIARDLRGLGQYQESLDIARYVAHEFDMANARESTQSLVASEQFATALRKAGHHSDAFRQREYVLQRYRDYLGEDHMGTLTASTNLVSDRLTMGDFDGAIRLADETFDRCQEVTPPHDLLCAAQLNLASALRAMGNIGAALANDRQARNGLIGIYGDRHPFTLAASVNYAADLAQCDRLGEAIQLGRETLAKYDDSLGDSHPDTLIAAANLAIDEATAGDEATAERRLSDVLARYADTLTLEHPDARAAKQRQRQTAEFEPLVG